MDDRVAGWGFVALQVVLLVTLVALPGADHWPTPVWLHRVGLAIVATGVAVAVAAGLRLGRALTPTPVPVPGGRLAVTGLYRWSRHPIYTGVLTIVMGMTLPSGNLVTLGVAAVTFAFFHVKARWEEQRLATAYPGYAGYARTTPRFFPGPWHRRRRSG